MKTIDLTPLYRSSIGYDRLASLLDTMFHADTSSPGYPPYDIEMLDENHYAISLAVAGFKDNELNIEVERGVLTVRGEKAAPSENRNYLYQGIAARTFVRKFNLAEYVEVTNAKLSNGLLTISLKREIPETMKPKRISISSDDKSAIEHQADVKETDKAA
ncbi:Hsp20 family protein [Kaarinaea lacus]